MNTPIYETLAAQTTEREHLTDAYVTATESTKIVNTGAFKIQSILVPINSLESGRPALRSARWFAEQFGAKITILYAALPGGSTANPQELQDKIISSMGIKSDRLRAVLIRADVTNHRPIREAAREEAADLIIIPGDFHWGLNHFWQTDPLERLMRHAPCPLLIVANNESHLSPAIAKDEVGRINTDEELKRHLLMQLKLKLGDRAKDIGVSTLNSIVMLKGSVSSSADKRIAVEIVKHMNGVLAWADDMTLQLPGGRQIASRIV